jgi:aminoglycoside phosphotransferase family enzyme/predicted kinase
MIHLAEYETLQQPEMYPEGTSQVGMRETHISWVYITDHYVYKVKKPIDLRFLDFSTLDKRKFYCEQELRLNRRLSTSTYLDVVPLRQRHGGVCLDGDGPIVDYAVKMNRLSEDHLLETLLRRGELSHTLVSGLAERLAAFHRDHPLPSTERTYGTLDVVREDWEENFSQTEIFIGQTIAQDVYDQIVSAVRTFMHQYADWFAQRVEQAQIRDCHGDLRAEHIYVDNGAFQIIDCIEFNHRFRYIDVASEVAFLAMDLDRLGAPDAARQFVQAYVQASGDVELYRMLEFYGCYRAYVRAKVTSMRVETASPRHREDLIRLAETYFSMARRYASGLGKPLLLLTTGLIGSGKSTIAERMATVLDLELVSSDRMRKQDDEGSPPSSRSGNYGQGLYTEDAKRQVYKAMIEGARNTLLQGQSVLLDASFAKREERQQVLALAQDRDARLCLLECLAPESVIRARLKARDNDTETLSDAREDILDDFKRDYEPVCEGDWPCHVRVDTTQDGERCVQQVLAEIYAV